MTPPTPLSLSANQNKFATPSQDPEPAALPVALFEWLREKERPHPSVKSSAHGTIGQGFARSGFPDGVPSLQYRGIAGI